MNIQSIGQTQAFSGVSDKYSFIPTSRVLDVFADYGYQIRQAKEVSTRKEEYKGFQKHIVRLRKESDMGANVGDEFPEIVLINSHLGSASFQLSYGMYRKVCANGLCVSTEQFSEVRIRHTGFTDSAVEKAVIDITDNLPKLVDRVNVMKAIELRPEEALILAETATEIAFDGEKVEVRPEDMLRQYRYGDRGSDLWTTFNRLQENIIKGGVRTKNVETGRRVRARAINSIDRNVSVNRALWSMAEKMAELKAAH